MAEVAPEQVNVAIPRPKSQVGQSTEQLVRPKQTGAMDWVEMVSKLISKGRVKQAAIFDIKGKCLSASKDLIIPQDEVLSVVRVLDSEFALLNKPQFGLFFGELRYICFRADKSTVLGLTQNDFFVAHKCDDILIFAFCDIKTESEVSCIGEVWTFAREVKSRMEISTFIG